VRAEADDPHVRQTVATFLAPAQTRPILLAERGSLTIADAGQSRTLDLTREQLRNGAVAYHQIGERVQLRLEVSLPGRRTVSETWESPATGR